MQFPKNDTWDWVFKELNKQQAEGHDTKCRTLFPSRYKTQAAPYKGYYKKFSKTWAELAVSSGMSLIYWQNLNIYQWLSSEILVRFMASLKIWKGTVSNDSVPNERNHSQKIQMFIF